VRMEVVGTLWFTVFSMFHERAEARVWRRDCDLADQEIANGCWKIPAKNVPFF
jgi:hypothetical protein